jgi:hypothetical protein
MLASSQVVDHNVIELRTLFDGVHHKTSQCHAFVVPEPTEKYNLCP